MAGLHSPVITVMLRLLSSVQMFLIVNLMRTASILMIFMDMILAPEVAPEMTHINQRMGGPNLLERINKGKLIKHNEALHDDGAILLCCQKTIFCWKTTCGGGC